MNTRLTEIQVGVDNNGAVMVKIQRCLADGFSNAPQRIETSMNEVVVERFLFCCIKPLFTS